MPGRFGYDGGRGWIAETAVQSVPPPTSPLVSLVGVPSPPPPVLRNRPCLVYRVLPLRSLESPPQWGAADAEIKVPSGENTELERSPFKA